jgi:hypothetical protein
MRVRMAGFDIGMLGALSQNLVAHGFESVGIAASDANNLKVSDEHDTLTLQVHLEPLDHPKEAQRPAELSIEDRSHAIA